MKAMIAYKRNQSNRVLMNSWIAFADSCTHNEMVGILKYFLDLRPSAGIDQFKCTVTCLPFFLRVGLKEKFPTMREIVRGRIDHSLVVAWDKQAKKNKTPRPFLESWDDVLHLVLPKDELQKVVGHVGKWALVKDSLVAVTASGPLGRKMFGECATDVIAETVEKVINDGIDALFKDPPISQPKFDRAKRAVLTALRQESLAELPAKRMIRLPYRGAHSDDKVKCIGDEVEHRFRMALVAHAVEHKMLPALFCESELVDKQTSQKVDISEALLRGPRAATNAANAGVEDPTTADGPTIKEYLEKSEKELVGMDACWNLKSQWFISMVGKAGEEKLQERCLEMFPTETTERNLEACSQSVRSLAESALFKFCSETAQGSVEAVLDTLSLMLTGKAPAFKESTTEFSKKISVRLQYLARLPREGQPELVGARVVEAKLGQLEAKGGANCVVDDLELVVKYRWLLKPAEKQRADALRAEVIKKHPAAEAQLAGTPAKKGGASSSAPGAGSTEKTKKSTKNEVAAALEMFT